MRTPAILLAACLCACAQVDGPERDQVGNVYPAACRGDLSHVVASIDRVPHDDAWLQLLAAPGRPNLGRVRLATSPPQIIVSDRLAGWKLDDAIRHERCHVLTGAWHK